jgi:class 3 adenylate cyclase
MTRPVAHLRLFPKYALLIIALVGSLTAATGAIGNVTNLSARLCGEASGGEILVSQRVHGALQADADGLARQLERAGELVLKGLHRAVPAWRVKPGSAPVTG